MLMALIVAAAVAAGAHPLVIGVAAMAAFHPGWFVGAVVVWAVVERRRLATAKRPRPGDEVTLLHGMAAELRGGSSLRSALASAQAGAPRLRLARAARMAEAGLPSGEIAAALRVALPVNGRLAAAAFVLVSETGARAADVFDGLAARAAEAGDLARERTALTAQARLSALVVGLAPLGFAGVLMVTGRGSDLFASGTAGLVVAGLGFGLQMTGLAVVWLMLRAAQR